MKNLRIVHTKFLSKRQQEETALLLRLCRSFDGNQLSYPSQEEGTSHWLLYRREDGMLLACLALCLLDPKTAQCCAFTHPQFRNQGLFTRLLRQARGSAGKRRLLFAVSGEIPGTQAALQALGAALSQKEFQMELTLAAAKPYSPAFASLSAVSADWRLEKEGEAKRLPGEAPCRWLLFGPVSISPAAVCSVFPSSPGCVCLYQVEVAPSLRGQGIGTRMLALLLPRLASQGARKVLLHVSGDNPAALALYQKAGFSITETLLFYVR